MNAKALAAYQALMQAIGADDQLDAHALKVTSGFRNPAYNALVGGVRCSQHQLGTALDVAVGDVNQDGVMDAEDRQIVYELLDGQIIGNGGGVGTYENHPRLVHFDVRGYRARW